MKNLFLTLVVLVILNNTTTAQEIWGLNPSGGLGYGTLYGLPAGSTGIATLHNFSGNPGSNPQYTRLLEASTGKLYGMTNLGGANNQGVLFEYDTLTNLYSRKFDFGGASGANPKGALIQAANGKLYGMTQLGGSSNLGVIFEYNIVSNTYSVLVNFTGTGAFPGSQPMGALVQPDPTLTKLYGLTRFGGTNDRGVLFEFDYSTNTYISKLDFDGNTGLSLGGNPFGHMVKATSASSSTTTLFGLTSSGGVNNGGVLFEYDYDLNVYTKRIDLVPGTAGTGSSPQGSLLLASNGRLYGTTFTGGSNSAGVIFEYIIGTNTFNKLTNLISGVGSTGGGPFGDLTEAAPGKLFGLTRIGGATNVGAIFEYDITNPAAPVYTKRIDLSAANGSLPFGSLLRVSTGKLYGVTSSGGAVGGGVIFNYNISNNTYAKRIDFNLSAGGHPNGHLVQADNGRLYGLATVGGTNNSVGVIFEYDRATNIYTKKIDLSGNTGTNPGSTPYGSLVRANNTNLYGLTSAGGTSGLGTLFRYDATSNTYTKLVDFTGTGGANPGGVPYGSLAQFTGTGTANGKLYGMTKQGGASNQGVIFEFNISTNTYTKRIDLSLLSANGYSAFGSLVESANKFYGMTQLGGTNGSGVIFEYDPNTNVYAKRVDFTGTGGVAPGATPFGSLVQTATVGVLYGMTRTGGANNQGVIFEYNANTNTYTKKYDFATPNGSLPYGSLILSVNGKLYGVTGAGGANSSGVLFEYDITTSTYTKKLDFNAATGNAPSYTQLLEICTKPLTPGTITSSTNTLCQADAVAKTFSVSPVLNASSYAWTFPDGALITSSGTLASVEVNLSALAAGTYTYGVAGVNVCGTGTLSTGTFTVNALPVVSVNSGSVCSGASFTILPSGASAYSVQGGSFVVAPTVSSNYTVMGISAAGCNSSNTATASVVVNTSPVISVNNGTICSGNSFTLVPSGVVTSTPSGGSLIVSPGVTTSYTIIGSDANGCVSANTATSTVTVHVLPTISITSETVCAGSSATLVPSGAGTSGTYTMGVLNGSGPFVVSPAVSTSYTVAGTSSLGCVSSNTATASVTVHTLPFVFVNSASVCAGQAATITPGGAGTLGTYTVGSLSGSGPFVVAPNTSTNYVVSGTSSVGCISSNMVNAAVTVYTLPVISVTNGSICAGATYTFYPSGALTYTITGPVSGTAFPVAPIINSSYTIAGTSSDGCVSALPATANVTVHALPVLSVNSGSLCSGNTFTIQPAGGTSYTIQPGNIITAGAAPVNPVASTDYTVTGENAFGCISATMPVSSVSVSALPVISTQSGEICIGDVFTTTVSGASSYTYTSGASTLTAPGSVTLSPAVTSHYDVYGTSPDGCISASPALMSVTVNPLPAVSITGTNTICDGETTTLTAQGASSYNWGGSSGNSIVVNPVASAVYTVEGTDVNNCSAQASFTLTVNQLPVISVASGAMCPGNSFTLHPTGAATYTFSGGSNVVSPIVTTDYSITGTSPEGCVSLLPAVATVSVVNILTVTISGNTSVCLGGTLQLTANGASTYTWNNGVSTSTVNNLEITPTSAMHYTLVGASGSCSDTAEVTITVNPLPSVSLSSSSLQICTNESANLTVSGALTYVWGHSSSTSTLLSVSPSVSTVYSVTGTDANGCENTATLTLLVDPCLGISTHSGNAWLYTLYPNPSVGEFFVETSAGGVNMKLVNSLGQVISEQELKEGKNQVTIEQAKGIYFVQLKNGNTTKTIKVVKH